MGLGRDEARSWCKMIGGGFETRGVRSWCKLSSGTLSDKGLGCSGNGW